MTTATKPLWGRQRERAALSQLLSDVRSGRSRVLVLRGEPGIGKTALLDDLVARAGDVVVIRGAGAESEAELAFAGLHQMCSQMIQEKLDLLPAPQREAIRVADLGTGESAVAGRAARRGGYAGLIQGSRSAPVPWPRRPSFRRIRQRAAG